MMWIARRVLRTLPLPPADDELVRLLLAHEELSPRSPRSPRRHSG
jgi:hypothetical protein